MTPPTLLLGSAEALLNRFLGADPHSLERLAALGGSVTLRSVELDWEVGVFPVAHGILLAAPEAQPRASVTLEIRAIFAILRQPRAQRAVPGMQISGDAEYLQSLMDILQGVETDLAAMLEPWLGLRAAPVATGLQSLGAFLRRGWRQFEANSAEFLAEESRDVVPAAELEDWMNDVDELSLAVDRLDARLRRRESAR